MIDWGQVTERAETRDMNSPYEREMERSAGRPD